MLTIWSIASFWPTISRRSRRSRVSASRPVRDASNGMLNLVIFPLSFLIVRKYRHVRVPPIRLRWTDFAIRALLVASLVGAVVALSFRIGPGPTGVLAAFPVVFTSIMLILHHRIGGPAAAAVLASGILGLFGFGLAVLTLHVLAIPLGNWWALALGLAVSIAWNLMLFFTRRRKKTSHA